MLRANAPYQELGPDYFEQRRKTEIVKKSVKRLEALGYTVTIDQHIEASTA
jgi:muramoyltetrapeptide carboxypeptidase LdcA involved in peptidoglycan recycling